jgi:hypothetical protein
MDNMLEQIQSISHKLNLAAWGSSKTNEAKVQCRVFVWYLLVALDVSHKYKSQLHRPLGNLELVTSLHSKQLFYP